jgi:MerR family redox-sensitive transcriptional activator SoxR
MESFIPIGELATKADVNSSTIRYYESIGLMPSPVRVNGQRRYTFEVLDQLKFIKTAQLAGFTIQEITLLLDGFEKNVPPSERWKEMASRKCEELTEKRRQIDAMIDILNNGLKCECLSWSECFTKVKPNGTCS